jgi:hypothetical protein
MSPAAVAWNADAGVHIVAMETEAVPLVERVPPLVQVEAWRRYAELAEHPERHPIVVWQSETLAQKLERLRRRRVAAKAVAPVLEGISR